MDNILEILIPLIFAAVYFFGNMLSGKKEDEDFPSEVPRRSSDADEEDAAARQRRIQEEIRRKIMERRRANSGQGSPSRPQPQVIRPQREVVEQRREVRPPTPPVIVQEPAARKNSEAEGRFSWGNSDNAYDRDMESRLRQIEETKRRAARLKEQANAAHMKNDAGAEARKQKRKSASYFSGSVRESLGDPAAARVAFIYGEVLGRPVGMRNASSSNVPGLNQ